MIEFSYKNLECLLPIGLFVEMHPLGPSSAQYTIRLLVLSVGGARLVVEPNQHTCFAALFEPIQHFLTEFWFLLYGIFEKVYTCLCCCCLARKQDPQTISPSMVNERKRLGIIGMLNSKTKFNLKDIERCSKERIAFLKDISRYILQNQYDLVLLQEIPDHTAFVHLCEMLGKSHLQYSNYTPSCTLKNKRNLNRTGMAIFSRWPLDSVDEFNLDPNLSNTMLFTYRTLFSCFPHDPINQMNGIQHVRINLKNVAQTHLLSTFSINVFNVQLLAKDIRVLNRMIRIESFANNRTLAETEILRLCQVYELAKVINLIENASCKAQMAVVSDIAPRDIAPHLELYLIGGLFGAIPQSNPDDPQHISPKDILQTFVKDIHFANEHPSFINNKETTELLKCKSELFEIFEQFKNENLFIKYTVHQPKSVNSRHQCKVEFMHTTLKFPACAEVMNSSVKHTIDLPRGYFLR